jgi:sulfofructosephosphate aldolase
MSTLASALATLSNPHGVFTMVALDHRGSLQSIMESVGGRSVTDDEIRRFKKIAIRELVPHASACLLDIDYGLTPDGRSPLPAGTALILAAQAPDRKNGTTIDSFEFDARVTREFVEKSGAVALKLLVNWERRADRTAVRRLVSDFIALSRRCGVLSLVEGITWPSSDWASEDERDDAIIECAAELSAFHPDIYKAEVPGYRQDDLSRVVARSRELTGAISCPWVVLSHGVSPLDFPTVVDLCCAGGASGFLAGQAVWSDIARDELSTTRTTALFRGSGASRFRDLCESAEHGYRLAHGG